MLGLPDGAKACLFDLDGVLTQTAKVHAAAWKQMFDDFLRQRAESSDDAFHEIVDGKVAARESLKGKPAPDTFIYAARKLGVEPEEAVVFEDALAGVEA